MENSAVFILPNLVNASMYIELVFVKLGAFADYLAEWIPRVRTNVSIILGSWQFSFKWGNDAILVHMHAHIALAFVSIKLIIEVIEWLRTTLTAVYQ